jgi:exosortase/archaeosortase family protein
MATNGTDSAPEGGRQSREKAYRFVLRFGAIAAVLLTAYYFPYDRSGIVGALFRLYLAAYAHLAGAAISLFDSSVRVHGTMITGRVSLEFAMSCDAMDVFILFAAATLASPAAWRWRLAGLGAGFVSVAAVNVLRIVSLYWIGAFAPARFEFFHMQLWPLAIVVLASAGFVVWVRRARTKEGALIHAAVDA